MVRGKRRVNSEPQSIASDANNVPPGGVASKEGRAPPENGRPQKPEAVPVEMEDSYDQLPRLQC